MARPINAALVVNLFSPTGNLGEYTFEYAQYNNQADKDGSGAYAVQIGFVLYVPSTDANTALQIPGVVHRYRFTSVTPVDPQTLSGTIVWDESGVEETEIPTNGIGCLLSETSTNKKLGSPPSDAVYLELTPGTTVESILVDSWEIVDEISNQSSSGIFKETVGDGTSQEVTISHNLNSMDVSVDVFELDTGATVYCGVTRDSSNSVTLSFTEAPTLDNCRVLVRAA